MPDVLFRMASPVNSPTDDLLSQLSPVISTHGPIGDSLRKKTQGQEQAFNHLVDNLKLQVTEKQLYDRRSLWKPAEALLVGLRWRRAETWAGPREFRICPCLRKSKCAPKRKAHRGLLRPSASLSTPPRLWDLGFGFRLPKKRGNWYMDRASVPVIAQNPSQRPLPERNALASRHKGRYRN